MTDAPAPGDWVVRRASSGTVRRRTATWMLYREPNEGDPLEGNDLVPMWDRSVAAARADGLRAWWQPTGGAFQLLRGADEARG